VGCGDLREPDDADDGSAIANDGDDAREMLVEAAAERWKADPAKLVAEDGRVTNPATSASLGYGRSRGARS